MLEQLTPSLRAHAAAARTHHAKLEALEDFKPLK